MKLYPISRALLCSLIILTAGCVIHVEQHGGTSKHANKGEAFRSAHGSGHFTIKHRVSTGYLDEQKRPSDTPLENSPLKLKAALSHSEYIRGNPERTLLKLDIASTQTSPPNRPPLNLALVLDHSRSMADDHKLDYTLEAARSVIANLSAQDFISIVAYSDRVVVLSPAGRAINKDFLNHRLEELSPNGFTDISAGLLEGIAQVASQAADGQVKHVLLLTDGRANRGVTGRAGLRRIAESAHHQGIGVSTLGCGSSFNELLLAESGGGRYTYVDSPEELPRAFEAELHGLLDVVAQNVRLEVGVRQGGQISKVYGQMLEHPIQAFEYEIGNLRAGERSVHLVELVPLEFAPGSAMTVEVRLTGDDPQTGHRLALTAQAKTLLLPDGASGPLNRNSSVIIYGDLIEALQSAEEALHGLDHESYETAHSLFETHYDRARKHAFESKDQDLLNQTFMLRHFMQELAAADQKGLMHAHGEARQKLIKSLDYQRYLMQHHQPDEKENH